MKSIIAVCSFSLLSIVLLQAQTQPENGGFKQEGIASWYGDEFEGRPTASGEPFNPKDFTAAHPTLPFGTVVTITNVANNNQVQVKINDRGPFVSTRIIDVSKAAAEKLGILDTGTGQVIVEMAPRGFSPVQTNAQSAPIGNGEMEIVEDIKITPPTTPGARPNITVDIEERTPQRPAQTAQVQLPNASSQQVQRPQTAQPQQTAAPVSPQVSVPQQPRYPSQAQNPQAPRAYTQTQAPSAPQQPRAPSNSAAPQTQRAPQTYPQNSAGAASAPRAGAAQTVPQQGRVPQGQVPVQQQPRVGVPQPAAPQVPAQTGASTQTRPSQVQGAAVQSQQTRTGVPQTTGRPVVPAQTAQARTGAVPQTGAVRAAPAPARVPAPQTNTYQAPIKASQIQTPQSQVQTPPQNPNAPPAEIKGGPIVAGRIYRLQIGSFKVPRNAVDVFDKLSNAGLDPKWEPFEGYYRIVITNVKAEDIQSVAQRLGAAGFKEAIARIEGIENQ